MAPRARLTPRPPHTFDRQARIHELEDTVRELVSEIDRQREALERFSGYRREMVAANHSLMSDLRAVCTERDFLRGYLALPWWKVLLGGAREPEFRGPATEHVEANYQVDGLEASSVAVEEKS